MPTIDMQDTNRRAILALDAGDIFHAERLFARNYRAHPCLMTALNYANFLGDCHHLSGQGIAAELVGGGGSAAGADVCREFRAGSAGSLGRRADCLPTGQPRLRPVNSPPDAQCLPLHRLPDSW